MLYLCNSHGRPLPCRGRVSVTHTHHFFRIYTSTTEIYTLSLHDALPIFLQLGEDVAQRRLAHPVGHVPSEIEGPQPLGDSRDLVRTDSEVRGNPLHELVSLGMHGGVVERIDPTANPEESGGLLERLRPELRHLPEVVSTPEHSVRIAMGHDVPGHRRGESRHVAEQLFRGRVHVDADVIHATLYRLLQLPLQQPLIDVVLVLAHADRLRIDLHELRERILKPASDAHRSADGDVEVRDRKSVV